METTPQTATGTPVADPDKQNAAFETTGSGATSGYGGAASVDDDDEPGDDLPDTDVDDDADAPDDMDIDEDVTTDSLGPDDDAILEGEPLDEDIDDDLDDDL